MEREVLRPAELAPLLGVTTGRIYQLISDGVIPAVRIGGALRIPRATWEGWLRDQQKEAITAARRARRKHLTAGSSERRA